MRMKITAALLGAVVGASASAQSFYDEFNFPTGTVIPGYTEQRGDWQATGSSVQSNVGTTFQELTYDSIKDVDCCVETLCNYDFASPQLMYCGPIARYQGAGASANFFMIKVQDNGSPRDGWDTAYLYYYNGSSFGSIGLGSMPISPPSKQTRVRLQVIDQGPSVLVQVYLDTDNDGKWDITNSTTTANLLGQGGLIGANGYRNGIVDNLKYFDVPLWLSGTPSVGTSVKIPGRGTPNDGYVGACSFSRGPIQIDATRAVPLGLDPLFFTTFPNAPAGTFVNFLGFCDTQGDFTMGLNIPALAALVGQTIYTSGVTYGRAGITGVCPDVEVTFQP